MEEDDKLRQRTISKRREWTWQLRHVCDKIDRTALELGHIHESDNKKYMAEFRKTQEN